MKKPGNVRDYLGEKILIQRRDRQSSPPALVNALVVEEVPPLSPGGLAGVQVGDYLITIDGLPASERWPSVYQKAGEERSYVFYSLERKERIEFTTSGIEPGVIFRLSGEGVWSRFDRSHPNYRRWVGLWKEKQWDRLEEMASLVLFGTKEPLEMDDISWDAPPEGTSPAYLFLGIALYEKGQLRFGRKLIDFYARRPEGGAQPELQAIGLHYMGREIYRKGNKIEGLSLLNQALYEYPYPQIAREIEKLQGSPVEETSSRWLGKRFPITYQLEMVGGQSRVDLGRVLNDMKKHQVLVLSFWGAEIKPAVEKDLIERASHLVREAGEYLYAFHGITMENAPQEKALGQSCKTGIDGRRILAVLWDEDGLVTSAVMPNSFPCVLVLDSKGAVLQEGRGDSGEFWRSLEKVAEQEPLDDLFPEDDDRDGGDEREDWVEQKLAQLLMKLELLSVNEIETCVIMAEAAGISFAEAVVQQGIMTANKLEEMRRKVVQGQEEQLLTGAAERRGKIVTPRQMNKGGGGVQAAQTLVEEDVERSTGQEPWSEAVGEESSSGTFVQKKPEGESSPSDLPLRTGETIMNGEIEVLQLLGEGGMGAVYLGYQESLGRRLAIKVISSHLVRDHECLERFEREARTAAQLSHPNIIQVYGVGEDKVKYIIMEYVEGASLQNLIEMRGKLEPAEALAFMIQAARGLAEAHRQGILHRDIKPDNIFIDRNRNVKLGDFGIAKDLRQSAITQTGAVMGTPHYMSPEQASGREIDNRSDIYSLGASFFHALTGHPPFEGESAVSVLFKQVNQPIAFPKALRGDIHPTVRKLVEKMMAKEKWRRHNHTEDLVVEMEDLLASLEMGEVASESRPSSGSRRVMVQARSSRRSRVIPSPEMETARDLPEVETGWPKALIAMGVAGCILFFGLVYIIVDSGLASGEKDLKSSAKQPVSKVEESPSDEKDQPRDPKELPKEVMGDLIGKMSHFVREKKWTEAQAYLTGLTEKHPESREVRIQLKRVKRLAAKSAKKAQEVETHLNNAEHFERMGSPEMAFTDYRAAYAKTDRPEVRKKIAPLLIKHCHKAVEKAMERGNLTRMAALVGELVEYGGSYPNWPARGIEARKKIYVKEGKKIQGEFLEQWRKKRVLLQKKKRELARYMKKFRKMGPAEKIAHRSDQNQYLQGMARVEGEVQSIKSTYVNRLQRLYHQEEIYLRRFQSQLSPGTEARTADQYLRKAFHLVRSWQREINNHRSSD